MKTHRGFKKCSIYNIYLYIINGLLLVAVIAVASRTVYTTFICRNVALIVSLRLGLVSLRLRLVELVVLLGMTSTGWLTCRMDQLELTGAMFILLLQSLLTGAAPFVVNNQPRKERYNLHGTS